MGEEFNEGGQQQIPYRQLLGVLERKGLKVHESRKGPEISGSITREGLETLSPASFKILEDLAERARAFISGVYVEDSFGDTFEGRQARQNLWSQLKDQHGPQVGEIQLRDKLKLGSSVGTTKAYFEMLVSELNRDQPVNSEKAEDIRELYKKFLSVIPFTEEDRTMTTKEDYIHKTFEERVMALEEIDKVLLEFLALVSTSRQG